MKKVLFTVFLTLTLSAGEPTVASCKDDFVHACAGGKGETPFTNYCECAWRTVARLRLTKDFDLELKQDDLDAIYKQCGRLAPKDGG